MPGGKGNINGAADGTPWTSEHQPTNRKKPTKFLTELLIKGLKKKTEIIIEGYDVQTGKLTKVRVPMPTRETIVQALLRQAGKGNINHIREVFDRTEGKVSQPVDLAMTGTINLFFMQDTESEPIDAE